MLYFVNVHKWALENGDGWLSNSEQSLDSIISFKASSCNVIFFYFLMRHQGWCIAGPNSLSVLINWHICSITDYVLLFYYYLLLLLFLLLFNIIKRDYNYWFVSFAACHSDSIVNYSKSTDLESQSPDVLAPFMKQQQEADLSRPSGR